MLIILNNKCNLTKQEFINYQEQLEQIEATNQIILCPSNVYLGLFNSKTIELGSQNVSSKDMGSYTGEISAKQLKSFDVKYCIVGHSERRKYQQETTKDITNKIKQLLDNDINPIYCIGETKEEKESNKVEEVLTKEILDITKDLTEEEKERIIIAYEPIWSIGTGKIPTQKEINNVIQIIKNLLPNNKVVYGGSANAKNIDILKEVSDVDGYLLGGLSLDVENLKIFIEKLEI